MDPDALHARLAAAARHRRSLNNEAIVCLEAGLGATPGSVEQQLAEIRALRQSLGPAASYEGAWHLLVCGRCLQCSLSHTSRYQGV